MREFICEFLTIRMCWDNATIVIWLVCKAWSQRSHLPCFQLMIIFFSQITPMLRTGYHSKQGKFNGMFWTVKIQDSSMSQWLSFQCLPSKSDAVKAIFQRTVEFLKKRNCLQVLLHHGLSFGAIATSMFWEVVTKEWCCWLCNHAWQGNDCHFLLLCYALPNRAAELATNQWCFSC